MTMSKVNWKDSQILNLVSEEVRSTPDNLRAAFSRIAQRLNITNSIVRNQWYCNGLREALGTQFTTQSRDIKFVNKKNSPQKKETFSLIYEKEVDSRIVEGMRIVTIRQYYAV